MLSVLDIRNAIEARIMTASLEPGSRVNENAIASELNASRSSVREAVRLLEQSGLLRFEDNRGAFVRAPSFDDVLDLYEIRAGLSASAARLAALHATIDDLHALDALLSEMKTAGNLLGGGYSDLNEQFHEEIFRIAGNKRLQAMHRVNSNELRLFVSRGTQGPNYEKVSAREHRQIVEAIKTGDTAEASRAFERHVLHDKQRMVTMIVRQIC